MQQKTGLEAVQFRIARPTDQLVKVVRFYKEAVGLKEIGSFTGHAGYDGVMFGLPGLPYHLEFTSYVNGSPCPAPSKDNLLVLYFDSTEKYQKAVDRMLAFGARPVKPENSYWESKSQTFEDPDGWRIVFFNGTFK